MIDWQMPPADSTDPRDHTYAGADVLQDGEGHRSTRWNWNCCRLFHGSCSDFCFDRWRCFWPSPVAVGPYRSRIWEIHRRQLAAAQAARAKRSSLVPRCRELARAPTTSVLLTTMMACCAGDLCAKADRCVVSHSDKRARVVMCRLFAFLI